MPARARRTGTRVREVKSTASAEEIAEWAIVYSLSGGSLVVGWQSTPAGPVEP